MSFFKHNIHEVKSSFVMNEKENKGDLKVIEMSALSWIMEDSPGSKYICNSEFGRNFPF